MALKLFDADSVQRYSTMRRRSLIAMVARRVLFRVNGSASHALVRPFVVMAARALGPGPTRLRLVKLAHNLDRNPFIGEGAGRPERGHADDSLPAVQPTTRAA